MDYTSRMNIQVFFSTLYMKYIFIWSRGIEIVDLESTYVHE